MGGGRARDRATDRFVGRFPEILSYPYTPAYTPCAYPINPLIHLIPPDISIPAFHPLDLNASGSGSPVVSVRSRVLPSTTRVDLSSTIPVVLPSTTPVSFFIGDEDDLEAVEEGEDEHVALLSGLKEVRSGHVALLHGPSVVGCRRRHCDPAWGGLREPAFCGDARVLHRCRSQGSGSG